MRSRLGSIPVAALAATAAATFAPARDSAAKAKPIAGFTLAKVVVLGDPAPGGGNFVAGTDFEFGDINNKGQIAFVTEVPEGEGLFLLTGKTLKQIARPGTDSPAGGKLGPGTITPFTLNERGEIVIIWNPQSGAGQPLGVGNTIYRWSRNRLSTVFTLGESAPGGGTFQGSTTRPQITNRGEVYFSALVSDADIDPTTPPGDQGLGLGIFKSDAKGRISAILRPGDAAPGGKVFDLLQTLSVNARGDMAFGAHVAGEPCVNAPSQNVQVFCGESVYLRRANGQIESIAHQGDAASGGTFVIAWGPTLNDAGDILFVGTLTPAGNDPQTSGVFLHHAGFNAAVVRPGDLMPGGGHVTDTTYIMATYDLNNRGDVVFSAVLDTDDDHDGKADSGVFMRLAGAAAPIVVARTGTVVPNLGTVAHVQSGFNVGGAYSQGQCRLNDRGEVALECVLADGRVVLLKATPHK